MFLEEFPALNVTESTTMVTVTASLAMAAQRDVVVNVATMNGSATCKQPFPSPPLPNPHLSHLPPSLPPSAPGDFTAVDEDVTFMAGTTSVSVMVSVLDDMALEGPENFMVVLTSEDPDVDVVNSTVTVTILPDADSKVACAGLGP